MGFSRVIIFRISDRTLGHWGVGVIYKLEAWGDRRGILCTLGFVYCMGDDGMHGGLDVRNEIVLEGFYLR
jgi:hypothetical protein